MKSTPIAMTMAGILVAACQTTTDDASTVITATPSATVTSAVTINQMTEIEIGLNHQVQILAATDVAPNSPVTSEPFKLTGLASSTDLLCEQAACSINDEAFVHGRVQVSNEDEIRLQTSSGNHAESLTARVYLPEFNHAELVWTITSKLNAHSDAIPKRVRAASLEGLTFAQPMTDNVWLQSNSELDRCDLRLVDIDFAQQTVGLEAQILPNTNCYEYGNQASYFDPKTHRLYEYNEDEIVVSELVDQQFVEISQINLLDYVASLEPGDSVFQHSAWQVSATGVELVLTGAQIDANWRQYHAFNLTASLEVSYHDYVGPNQFDYLDQPIFIGEEQGYLIDRHEHTMSVPSSGYVALTAQDHEIILREFSEEPWINWPSYHSLGTDGQYHYLFEQQTDSSDHQVIVVNQQGEISARLLIGNFSDDELSVNFLASEQQWLVLGKQQMNAYEGDSQVPFVYSNLAALRFDLQGNQVGGLTNLTPYDMTFNTYHLLGFTVANESIDVQWRENLDTLGTISVPFAP